MASVVLKLITTIAITFTLTTNATISPKTTTTTMAHTAKIINAVGVTTICPEPQYPIYATDSLIVGAPAFSEVCWRGGFTSTDLFTATIGLTLPFGLAFLAFSSNTALCNANVFPAYISATTDSTLSWLYGQNQLYTPISVSGSAAQSRFMCSITTTAVPSVCQPTILAEQPGSAYVAVSVLTIPEASQWSTICQSVLTDDINVTGAFVPFAGNPVSWSMIDTLFQWCPVSSLLLNQQATPGNPNPLNWFTNPAVITPTTLSLAAPARWAVCSMVARQCGATVSGWFLGSIYPAMPTGGGQWNGLCAGYITGGSQGTLVAPSSPTDQSALASVRSLCPFASYSMIYTSGVTDGNGVSYRYGWCSLTPLTFSYSTQPATTTTSPVIVTVTTTRALTTITRTDSATYFSLSTTFLVTSTSITTTSTLTVVSTTESTTTTTTTTTTTRTRIISDSTTATRTVSVTLTESVTTKSTASLTETVRTSEQTTITRLYTRTSCQPTVTTITTTTSVAITTTDTVSDTVYIDVTVYTTITYSANGSKCEGKETTKTRTLCSTSTSIVCETSVAFSRPGQRDDCPRIEAVMCNNNSGGDDGITMLFNALPYSLATCPCEAIGRSILVLHHDQDFLDAYGAVSRCGGGLGRAWVVVGQDYTRCYVASADGTVTPAASCDEPLPVLCK